MKSTPDSEFLDELVQIPDIAGQRAFVTSSPPPISQSLIEALSERIREWLPRDSELAEALTETNLFLASKLDTPLSMAFATQCRAHVLMNVRRNQDAQPLYERAAKLFSDSNAEIECGRTLSAAAENLTVLGEYERARELAERARDILEANQDTRYLARVHVALGNLFNRLNRLTDSLEEYDRAQEVAQVNDDHMVVAAVEINRAETLTECNRLDDAIRSLEAARDFCGKHKIVLWDEIVDRNLADLHFKRGSYTEALRSLEKVRPRYEERGDSQRLALCDLGRAEVYLQLNLPAEAAGLASSARDIFEDRSSRSEMAECSTLMGIAESEQGEESAAEKSFLEARELFKSLGNVVSTAGADLQLAKLKHKNHDVGEGERMARSAARAFEAEGLVVRGAYARITLAHILRTAGRDDDATAEAELALENLAGYHARWVSYQCHDLLATLYASRGENDKAEKLYLEAIDEMESLRGNIRLDEFRMSFGRDKYQVYENLVHLKIESQNLEEAFAFVERSKSRTLIDLLERNTDSVWDSDRSSSKQQAIRKLRQDLNGLYSQLSQVGTTISALSADKSIQNQISESERQLMSLLREAGTDQEEWVSMETVSMPTVSDAQDMLEEHEVLLEYYVVHGQFCVFVLTTTAFHLVSDLGSTQEVRDSLKGLNFQLSKFHLSPEYVGLHRDQLLIGVQHHLRELYRVLLKPVEQWIENRSLVIVPHHVLHYVPFHALYDGAAHLVDQHDVVYGASASVLRICRSKATRATDQDLVLAVPDESTPSIRDEAETLRQLLPNAKVFIGEEARAEVLQELGPRSGRLHIAAHGVFRSDNPMFSSIQLGDSWLNLMDIFNLKLGADLTTLSACETGMSALYEGDELLGLTRGFLYAGTPSLVVSLWRVNDTSTTLLMKRFYEGLLGGEAKPEALRQAMLAVKEQFPHPYYWAPFILMGKS